MSDRSDLLFEAVKGGDVEALVRLLDAGASINARNCCGETPLIVAVEEEQVESVRMLLDRGTALDARDDYGISALSAAIPRDELMELLLKAGANPNVTTSSGLPVLSLRLCYDDAPRGVRMLLEHGADPDQRDSDGETPLGYALYEPEAVELLLQHGADPSIRSPRGQTLVEEAYEECCRESARILEEALRRRRDGA